MCFCYRDIEMYNHHLTYGYSLNTCNEGCFCNEAKSASLKGRATLFEFESEADFTPETINLLVHEINYYRLILPASVEKSSFSKRIFDLITETIASE